MNKFYSRFKKPLACFATAALALAVAPIASAQIALVNYNMIENPGNWLNPSEAPAAVASGLSASHITRGPGVSGDVPYGVETQR